MKKTLSIILLAILLIGMLTLAACKPREIHTGSEVKQDSIHNASEIPASDTELKSTDEVPAANTQGQN